MCVTIAQVTDLHVNDHMSQEAGVDGRQNLTRILDDIGNRRVSHLVLTGDLGLSTTHQWLFDACVAHNLLPKLVLGNHDDLSDFHHLPGIADLAKPDGLYYSFDMGGVCCIFLDSSSGRIGRPQFSWLATSVAGAIGKVAIFTHHPVLDCGRTVMDRKYPLKNRRRVANLLRRSGKQVTVFCGHHHTTHEQKIGNIAQYVTPSSLLQLIQRGDTVDFDPTTFGYRLIELSPDGVKTDVVSFSVNH